MTASFVSPCLRDPFGFHQLDLIIVPGYAKGIEVVAAQMGQEVSILQLCGRQASARSNTVAGPEPRQRPTQRMAGVAAVIGKGVVVPIKRCRWRAASVRTRPFFGAN